MLDYRNFTEHWIKRAERDDEAFDKADNFIALWIAFNGWMKGKFGETKGDHELINKVKTLDKMVAVFNQLKCSNEVIKQNLDELQGSTIMNMRYINDRNKDKKFDGGFESLLDVIYQIRCNLFHGRKGTKQTEEDYRLICLAYDILSPLFKTYLNEHGYN